MITVDSHGTAWIDGKPVCVKCGREPKRWSGGRWQSYGTNCHREYNAGRRAGKIETLLTPDELEAVRHMRHFGTVPAGRHRR